MYKLIRSAILGFIIINSFQTGFAQSTLNLSSPPDKPELFGGSLINTRHGERDFALSPDGNEMFYTLQSPEMGGFQTIIHRTKNSKGEWSKPKLAPFAGKFSDLEPAFSHDGNKLYFSSNRPTQGSEAKDFDIWMVEKKNGQWGTPQNLGAPVNTDKNEFYPAIAISGNLYFTAAYKNAIGREDIYIARYANGKYSEPTPLDTAVNSKAYEFNAYVSPDEKIILFTSFGRRDDMGGGDLYMSVKDASGNWQPAKNLALLNSTKIDYCPFLSFDKKTLFFTSDRNILQTSYPNGTSYEELTNTFNSINAIGGNIYWVSFDKILELYK